ncbi:MAG: carboxypeptidase regulatory-like domain-containing protein [Gemmatimonadetes bacterium]|nr:carboxypeptidase regulatory-like domain-containing protein [Gemmatimonadota bacterium]
MRFSILRSLVAAAFALAASAGALTAQVGSTTDIITGKVTDTTGRPINGATVTATSIETRVSRSRTTGPDGKYTILFPDGGGAYRLTVRAIGVAPQTVQLSRQGDEDRLEKSFRMTVNAAPQNLQAVTVQARRNPNQGIERPAPGGSERTFSADQQSRLPVDANDVNTLAALAPGVVGVGSTDSTSASFAVAGQRTTQNNLTLDGISFGSGSIPQEAVRGTRVITSTYDVARGQFTGGQVATTTRSGTNVLQGSATFNMRDPSLQWTPAVTSSFGQGYNQATFSAGLGGPIIEDRLFYFGALQWRQQLNPIQTITSADSLSLVRLGLAPDSVSRFLGQLGTYGLPVTVSGIPGRRTNNNLTGIARVDFNITDEHTLTMRGDYRWTEQDASRIGSYSTPNHGGNSGSTGGGLQVTLTSRMASFRVRGNGRAVVDLR